MGIRRHVLLAGNLMVACMVLIMAASCAGNRNAPTTEGSPMVQPADAIIFQYQMAKQTPAQEDTRPLGNTRWEVTSINPKPEKSYTSMFLQFQPDGNLLETTKYPDGSVKNETSRYHMVGSTILISKAGKDVNARYKKEGNSLVIDTAESSMLLKAAD
jgi:hypothetical protein